ncbi:MAG: hypothetical protein ABSC94_03505 [Polyangiaceae bacterium]|jgi:hypothetical protein
MTRPTRLTEDVAARRRQEDESPRLLTIVPHLVSLRLELKESRGEGQVEFSHIKRIALDNAPSVFTIPCGEPRCKRGSYDLTDAILAGLRRGESRIEAVDTCMGDVGTARCGRVLRCVAVAEYAPTR